MAVFEVQNSNGRFTLRLTVTENSTSVDNNTSSLSFTFELIANTSYWFSDYNIGQSVSIDGSTVYYVARADSGPMSIPAYGTIAFASGGVTVVHDSDGSKTIPVAFSIDMASATYTPGPLSGSGSMALTTIPRASKLGSISNFDVESSITIPITKYSSVFTDNLTISYGGTTIKTVSGISNGAAVSFTASELNTIYGLMSTVKSGTFTFSITTYNGSTALGSSVQTATGSISNANPTLSATVIDVNSTTVALTGNSAKLVKYKSTARVTITASGNKGASISSKVVNGTAVTGNTLDIANISVTPLTVTVTDSRGNSTTVTLNPIMIAYVPLTISASFYRPAPTTGQVAVKFSGNYFNGSFGATANTLTLSWKYRLYGASTWTTGGTFAAGTNYTLSGNTFASGEISLGTGFDYESNYEFIIYFADQLISSDTGAIFVSKGKPVFDWGENDISFNVPISSFSEFTEGLSAAGCDMRALWNHLFSDVPPQNLIANGNFSNGTTGWTGNSATLSINADGSLRVTGTNTYAYVKTPVSAISGHKYYICASLKGVNDTTARIRPMNSGLTVSYSSTVFSNILSSEFDTYSLICTASESSMALIIYPSGTYTETSGKSLDINCVIVVDLTARFGSGFEPSIDWCDIYLSAIKRDGLMALSNYLFTNLPPTNLITNGNFGNGTTGWGAADGTIVASNNECALTLTATSLYTRIAQAQSLSVGKLYFAFDIFPKHSGLIRFYTSLVGAGIITVSVTANEWNIVSGIFDNTTAGSATLFFMHPTSGYGYSIGEQIKYRKTRVINLSARFGTNNEPSKEWCDTYLASHITY